MKVLVVGGGGREHALAWKLKQSRSIKELFCLPGNAGTRAVATNLEGSATDVDAIVRIAQERAIDFVVVGPEDALVAGLIDRLRAAGIAAFGPDRAAAQLEGSKAFAKQVMAEAGVPTAAFQLFTDADEAEAYVRAQQRPLVVKADGLAAGKGVVVARDADEAAAAIDHIIRKRAFGAAGDRIVIEETLRGQEVSYHVVSDGERYVALAPAQDHKRVGDGDSGPNTGGMGAYSPPPVVTPEVEQKIIDRVIEPTLALMKKRGTPFRGALFVGLMIEDGEPSVLEYNTRFGDPETEVLLVRWKGDLLPLLLGSARGDLSQVKAEWSAPCALSVVIASEGYPVSATKGRRIQGLDRVGQEAIVFHAGTAVEGDKIVTAGGRVLAVTATGQTVDEAAARAYAVAHQLHFEGAHYRSDIGHHARTTGSGSKH
ncbi:MAG: Phosphoribosylamine--glycine ligase [Myxococcaceae bacterium]|nr:Phosphoribosylamine--glycine ligase [Myxococcaceae bacterium]